MWEYLVEEKWEDNFERTKIEEKKKEKISGGKKDKKRKIVERSDDQDRIEIRE